MIEGEEDEHLELLRPFMQTEDQHSRTTKAESHRPCSSRTVEMRLCSS